MYYLSKNPDSQNKILSEVSEFQSTILYDDLVNANYTKCCVQETFRICPTAFCLARILEEDMIVSGYSLKPGVRKFYFYNSLFDAVVVNFLIYIDRSPVSHITCLQQ